MKLSHFILLTSKSFDWSALNSAPCSVGKEEPIDWPIAKFTPSLRLADFAKKGPMLTFPAVNKFYVH